MRQTDAGTGFYGGFDTTHTETDQDVTGAPMPPPLALQGRSIDDLFEITSDPFRALGSACASLSSG